MKTMLLIYASLIFLTTSNSQNYIDNGGFETNTGVVCLGCTTSEKFFNQVQNWSNIGWLAQLHRNDYDFNKQELDWGFKKESYLTNSGLACISLRAKLNPSPDKMRNCTGGSSYIFTYLTKQIEKNQYFRIKYWVYIKNENPNPNYYKKESLILKQFGVSFSEKKPFIIDRYSELSSSDTPFKLDTIIFNKWISVEYILHSTAILNYLTIGWFDDVNNLKSLYNLSSPEFEFLVDDISVIKYDNVSKTDSTNALDYPFQERENFVKKNTEINRGSIESKSIYFDSGNFTLPDSTLIILKDFADQVRQENVKKQIIIEGYTDKIGNKEFNLNLSKQRASAVRNYLINVEKIPPYQVVLNYFGDSLSIESNETENGRSLNRRVIIKYSEILVSATLYATATKFANGGAIDSAFVYLKNWMKFENTDWILLLFDPELTRLRENSKWKGIEFYIRKSYQKHKKPELSFQLDSLYCVTQYFRDLEFDFENAKGYIPKEFKSIFQDINQALTDDIDSKLDKLIEKNGWPTIEEVGERAAFTPALVVLHSENIDLQKKYIPIFESVWKKNIIDGKWYGCLIDKILIKEKGVQRYGTLYGPSAENPTKFELLTLEDPEKLNKNRESIGLPIIPDISKAYYFVTNRQ